MRALLADGQKTLASSGLKHVVKIVSLTPDDVVSLVLPGACMADVDGAW